MGFTRIWLCRLSILSCLTLSCISFKVARVGLLALILCVSTLFGVCSLVGFINARRHRNQTHHAFANVHLVHEVSGQQRANKLPTMVITAAGLERGSTFVRCPV